MSAHCSWVWCDRPTDGNGWWCSEHGARVQSATTTLDAEGVSEQ